MVDPDYVESSVGDDQPDQIRTEETQASSANRERRCCLATKA